VPLRVRLRELVERNEGLHVTGEATSVLEALSAIERQRPDVVLLDLALPDGSGVDVLRAIRPLSSRPIVIVLTAQTDPVYRKSCLAAGADYFFTKSDGLKEMEDVLRGLPRASA
jgi:DNA-binding NarL/FixJ family response regulator